MEKPLTYGPVGNQFALPRGWVGKFVGRVMAVFNEDMERAVVNALGLQGSERVLEIGFGPGIGIRYLVQRLPHGLVAGIDPSEVMLHQARARSGAALAASRVDLRLGRASSLPWSDNSFDKVCTVNNIQLWDTGVPRI